VKGSSVGVLFWYADNFWDCDSPGTECLISQPKHYFFYRSLTFFVKGDDSGDGDDYDGNCVSGAEYASACSVNTACDTEPCMTACPSGRTCPEWIACGCVKDF
jgi:hypothetical protein